ncbi:MAG: NAD-dependent epimerase/dehydratase family protein, partial [Calditrichia bacterium]
DAWAEQVRQMMPEWLVHDLRIMYEHFQQHGLKFTDEELARQKKILGHAPRTYDSFVGETVALWKA